MKIIAEFCQNHNGDYDTLARMVESASKANATHGKIQNIFANDLTFRPQFEKGLELNGHVLSIKRPYIDEYNRLKKLEINELEILKFISLCHDNGIIPITTCFVNSHVKKLKSFGFNSIKVASYDCASFPMLRNILNTFDEIIISTGAMFDDEIEYTAKIFKNKGFAFLHCVTIYPTTLNFLNLSRIKYLSNFTKEVGFSDHTLVNTTSLKASKCAIYLGAKIIERHFTILPVDQTKDGPVSINSSQLKELFNFSKLEKNEQLKILNLEFPDWDKSIGVIKRDLTNEELLNRDYYRGRFASKRKESKNGLNMIYNWEELTNDE